MKGEKIERTEGTGFYLAFSDDKVERVNPIEYYVNCELEKRSKIYREIFKIKEPDLFSKLDDSFFQKEAMKSMQGFVEKFEEANLHPNFLELLGTTRKKNQISLLKGMSLCPESLMLLIMKSYRDYGFLYSKYRFERDPKNIEGKQKPKLARLNKDNTIEKIGFTNLTDGELKNVINQRKVIIAYFFEKDDFWHCFLGTYDSFQGKESWKSGQAHLHYISSSFGMSKEDLLKSLKEGKYKSTPVHVDLLNYGSQT